MSPSIPTLFVCTRAVIDVTSVRKAIESLSLTSNDMVSCDADLSCMLSSLVPGMCDKCSEFLHAGDVTTLNMPVDEYGTFLFTDIIDGSYAGRSLSPTDAVVNGRWIHVRGCMQDPVVDGLAHILLGRYNNERSVSVGDCQILSAVSPDDGYTGLDDSIRSVIKRRSYIVGRAASCTNFLIVESPFTARIATSRALELESKLQSLGHEAMVCVMAQVTPTAVGNFPGVDCCVMYSCPFSCMLPNDRDYPVLMAAVHEVLIALGEPDPFAFNLWPMAVKNTGAKSVGNDFGVLKAQSRTTAVLHNNDGGDGDEPAVGGVIEGEFGYSRQYGHEPMNG